MQIHRCNLHDILPPNTCKCTHLPHSCMPPRIVQYMLNYVDLLHNPGYTQMGIPFSCTLLMRTGKWWRIRMLHRELRQGAILNYCTFTYNGLFTLPYSHSDSDSKLNGSIILCRRFHIGSDLDPDPYSDWKLHFNWGLIWIKVWPKVWNAENQQHFFFEQSSRICIILI